MSCGNTPAKADPVDNKELERQVFERVSQLVQEKKECVEQNNRLLHDSCLDAELSWEKKSYSWENQGQTVLIMDRQNPTHLTLGRFRYRMKDVLDIGSDGSYSTSKNQPVKVSKGLVEIFEISGRLNPYIPAEHFSKMSAPIYKAFSSDFNKLEAGHGSSAFSIIGEYAPSASFVFAPPPLAPAEILCKKDWVALDTYINKSSASFAAKVLENKVSVINMSGGDDRPTARKLFELRCPGLSVTSDDEDRYLNSVKKFYLGLETLTGVVVVQSAIGSDANPKDYPIDCPAQTPTNRLRIGFLIDSQNTSIPQEGAALHQGYDHLLPDPSRPNHPCIDAYFNSGMDQRGGFNRESLRWGLGFTFDRIPLMYTSWIAPLASAAIVSAKKTTLQGLTGAQIVKAILKPGTPAVYDPLGNKSLEAFQKHIFEDAP
jgi:hypothetical protein